MSLGIFRFVDRVTSMLGVGTTDERSRLDARDRQLEDYLSAVGALKDGLDGLTGFIKGDGAGGFTAPRALTDYSSTLTLTNAAQGTGGSALKSGYWCELPNGLIYMEVKLVLGTSSASVSGLIGFSLPVTAKRAHGQWPCTIENAGVAGYTGFTRLGSTSRLDVYYQDTSGAAATFTPTSATAPFTFGAADGVEAWAIYEGDL